MHERLIHCFHLVFPEIAARSIPAVSLENTPRWDSLASVQLIALIEDEFNATVPLDEYGNLNSFEQFHDYLQRKVGE